ncbi:MAG: DUF4349 domain-containing protein [Actinomycetota bacterium]|nr:DUF4349 domain-containing protein [Actinomycetota bacterium]
MSPSDLIDELRAAKPVAPPELRERVREIAQRPEKRRVQLKLRRVAFATVPAALAVAVAVAVVHGLADSGPVKKAARGPTTTNLQPARVRTAVGEAAIPVPSQALAPDARRLQQFNIRLRVRVASVETLSDRTQKAMRTTRRLGGFVARANFNAPTSKRGESYLVVMVPVDRLQEALARFSRLGSIVAQHVAIKDVQKRAGEESSTVSRLERRVARLEREFSQNPTVGVERQLGKARRLLASAKRTRAATVRRAEFARIALTLTTKKRAAAAAHSSRLDRTLGDAAGILALEAQVLLFGLVVGGPLLLLGAAGMVLVRGHARREEERLLESA